MGGVLSITGTCEQDCRRIGGMVCSERMSMVTIEVEIDRGCDAE
jgi:hypothetical protein